MCLRVLRNSADKEMHVPETWTGKASETKGKEALAIKLWVEVVVEGTGRGSASPTGQELGEREEKNAGTGGGNWGNQMAMGAAKHPETRGGG